MTQATEWFLDDDGQWHTPNAGDRSASHCGRKWGSVQRVTTGTPPVDAVCPTCRSELRPAHAPNGGQGIGAPRKKKRSKALRKKMDELRKQGIREELLEPLAADALARGAGASHSVRSVSGGLPTLGKRHR